MRRALNCVLTVSLAVAALWLLDLPDVNSWSTLVVVGIGTYWADAEIEELRSTP
jgi:hypothetical protein